MSNMTCLTLRECNFVWLLRAIEWVLDTVKLGMNMQKTDRVQMVFV